MRRIPDVSWFQKKKFREAWTKVLLYALIIGAAIVFIIPVVWLVSTSLKEARDALDYPPQWIPYALKWSNYPTAMTVGPWGLYFLNTAIITGSAVIGQILSGSLVAFAFARLYARDRDFLFILLLATLMIPFQVTLIPLYTIFRKLGWLNTFKPLIVPFWFGGSAFYIFLMRQYFLTIPLEMDDAARLDGCNTFQIYYKIILPLSKPLLFAVAVFSFVANWNSFLGPLIYLDDTEKYTVTLGLVAFKSYFGGAAVFGNWPVVMAASLIVMFPCLLVFILCQKVFIRGIVITGIKG